MDSETATRLAPIVLASALVLVNVGIAGWDIWTTYHQHPGDSVSAIFSGWATKWPVLPFLLGMVLGHVFWSR